MSNHKEQNVWSDAPMHSPGHHLSPGFTSAGLFSHTRAEAVIQTLVDTVNAQQRDIKRLSTSVDYLSRILCEVGLDGEMTPAGNQGGEDGPSLVERVKMLEEKVTIPHVSSMTVGEGVAANRRTVARALHIISTKADADAMSRLTPVFEQRIDEAVKQLQTEIVDKECMSAVTDTVSAMTSRMEVLSRDMQNKVDNSSFKALASDANNIRGHADFVRRMENEVQRLSTASDQQGRTLHGMDDSIGDLSTRMGTLLDGVAGRPQMKDFNELRDDVSRLNSGSKEKADRDVVIKMERKLTSTIKELKGTKEDSNILRMSHESVTKELRCRLDDACTKREAGQMVGRCVEKKKFNEVLLELRAQVGAKAWDQAVRDLRQSVTDLSMEHANTKRMASLAAQFVDWYGKRGVAFENNLNSEKHLQYVELNGRQGKGW